MAAIITDQIRILNAKNFVSGVSSSSNAYYSFIGLPNPTDYQSDWNSSPPAPKDNFREENDYWDTMVALKKINASDVRQVIPKRTWTSGATYDTADTFEMHFPPPQPHQKYEKLDRLQICLNASKCI